MGDFLTNLFLGVLGLGGILVDGSMGQVVVFWSMGLWSFIAVCSARWFLVVIWWCLVFLGCFADDVSLVLGGGDC